MLMKLFAFISLLIFSAVSIFVAFPVEYARLPGKNADLGTVNRIALSLTDFYVRNGLKYDCENEVYFGYIMAFGGEAPGISSSSRITLEEKSKLVYFYILDVDYDGNIDEFIDAMLRYNTSISARCSRGDIS